MDGIALAASEMPLDLIETPGLRSRLHERGGEQEYRFLFSDKPPLLPVRTAGRILLVQWGNAAGTSRRLPRTGWTWKTATEQGTWQYAEPVTIPATAGLERGIWYRIRQGVHGLMVKDERGAPVVYVICEPATHYYDVMTRSKRMPSLLDETI